MQLFRKLLIRTTSGPIWVMYDNECSFCFRITSLLKKFDYFDKIQLVDKNWSGDFPEEGRAMIQETVVVYEPSKKDLFYKSKAVSKILLCTPFGFSYAWILALPGLSNFFNRIYDFISKNRMRL